MPLPTIFELSYQKYWVFGYLLQFRYTGSALVEMEYRGRTRTPRTDMDVNPQRPLLMNRLGMPVVPNSRRPSSTSAAALPLTYGPRQIGMTANVQHNGRNAPFTPATDPPVAFQLGNLTEVMQGLQAILEFQAPPKKDVIHKRFRILPSTLKRNLVKEQSRLASDFEKLAIHAKDQDFFDEHLQSTPLAGSRLSLHAKATPMLDMSIQFSRETLTYTQDFNAPVVFEQLKKELAGKVNSYMKTYTAHSINIYKALCSLPDLPHVAKSSLSNM